MFGKVIFLSAAQIMAASVLQCLLPVFACYICLSHGSWLTCLCCSCPVALVHAGADEEPLSQSIIKAGRVVDTTGAGDCFTAAYTVASLQGKPPQQCLLFSSAAASICVQRPGAMPSLPSKEEVETLMAKPEQT